MPSASITARLRKGAADASTFLRKDVFRNVVGILRYDRRRRGKLRPGDLAPDVELFSLTGERRTKLSELRGNRPLVVVFGSFT